MTILRILSATLAALALHSHAADFPTRPLTIVVPFGAGGTTDVLARGLAQEMGRVLGQSIVISNKAGASGIIGTTEVANAKNDGYTMGMLPVGPLTTQPNLTKVSYGPDSFDYVCLVYSNPQVLLVRADSPFKSLGELVAYAKQNPGKLNYATSGIGTIPHLALVALANATQIDMVHVPHKGEADALTSVLAGTVQMFVSHPTFLTSHAEKLRALFVMADARLPEFPNLPTMAEAGGPALGFEVWGGLAAPKGLPAATLAALENACKAATMTDAFRAQMATLHTPVKFMNGKAFGAFVASEFERNKRLLSGSEAKR
jgi:tripartite-type tricarboxylate transporter receptor subunit TctC